MTIATINPTTGRTEEEFSPIPDSKVAERIDLAAQAFDMLRSTSFEERREWMHRVADILDQEREQLARMLTREMGKTITAARSEVAKSASGMRFYADHAEEFLSTVHVSEPSIVGASAASWEYQPLGIVLAVMPWNYPLWQVLRFAAPALMAGNTGLLKHASNVPAAALYLDSLFERAGFPNGAFGALLINSRQVDAVIDNPRVVAVTLTGSEPAGRSVAARAGTNLKKTVLELGGSDPFIVMPSADISGAVATAVTARTQNNGQSCIAGKRFIVHADVFEEFTAKFSVAMENLVVGDPASEETDVGPLATETGRAELAELVDDAVSHGAQIITGGYALDRAGWFYAPTVITDISATMRIAQEETFGPVASLYEVDSLHDAIELANSTEFGLSSAIWTNDDAERDTAISALEAGAVFVNGMTASYPELPFGGIKNSGYGRELSAEGIREFCNLKTVWVG